MKILFVHQNFPGQFRHLAPALAKDSNNEVLALTMQTRISSIWRGVRVVPYHLERTSTNGIHPWLVDLETEVIRADAVMQAALYLREEGFIPDVIIVHPGWGEGLFLKEVWPHTKLCIYCEFFYNTEGADMGFDPEFDLGGPNESARIRLKNINNILHFSVADAGMTPTCWQASLFPEPFCNHITVLHDGIDTQAIRPNPHASIKLDNGLELTRDDEVVTFINRNLEPYRGYHSFMRALPDILRRRPNAQILLVGGDGVSYGAKPPSGNTWKNIFSAEVQAMVSANDWSRVHFLGNITHARVICLLQLSTVHVYLTYPFVLGWSILEAMSAGCAIVVSDTKPLHEVITDNETGLLVDFFDTQALANKVCDLLSNTYMRNALGSRARAFVQEKYDLHNVCLPRQLDWVRSIAGDLK